MKATLCLNWHFVWVSTAKNFKFCHCFCDNIFKYTQHADYYNQCLSVNTHDCNINFYFSITIQWHPVLKWFQWAYVEAIIWLFSWGLALTSWPCFYHWGDCILVPSCPPVLKIQQQLNFLCILQFYNLQCNTFSMLSSPLLQQWLYYTNGDAGVWVFSVLWESMVLVSYSNIINTYQ